MKPGRELDALIANKVLAYQGHPDSEPPYMIRRYDRDDRIPLPSFSTDIAAAWQVDRPGWVWEFQETSHDLTATLYPSPEARMMAVTSYPILPRGVALMRREWGDDKAGTYAWVRCLAALRAVGVEVGDA